MPRRQLPRLGRLILDRHQLEVLVVAFLVSELDELRSRGVTIEEYDVPRTGERRIDSHEVAELAATITDRLREEMSRHGN